MTTPCLALATATTVCAASTAMNAAPARAPSTVRGHNLSANQPTRGYGYGAVGPRGRGRGGDVTALRVQTTRRSPMHRLSESSRTVVTRASPGGSEASSSWTPSRRDLANGVFFAVSIPLWKAVLHDLGYLHGEEDEPAELPVAPPGSGYRTATFAGGCFWCMEKPFDIIDGVIATTSGYTGGDQANPTYHGVGAGGTGHRESVQILFDPSKVSYETLLGVYWRQVDPTTADGMFLDSGLQYSSAIFPDGPDQRRAAEESLNTLEVAHRYPAPITTKVIDFTTFWPAEKYHQNYYATTSMRYGFYRGLSGRDEFIQSVWGPEAVYGGGAKL
mmetsp:Transcript_11017/g.26944  ORF Transcript_11017/g.26944 Transcript_11017/m.26944 type:complete len:331 (-) Transcript_11017:41-1033(-)